MQYTFIPNQTIVYRCLLVDCSYYKCFMQKYADIVGIFQEMGYIIALGNLIDLYIIHIDTLFRKWRIIIMNKCKNG